MIYGKKVGVTGIQESKFAAKFSKRLSIRTVMSLRDISEKTWVHSYPVMPHAFTFYIGLRYMCASYARKNAQKQWARTSLMTGPLEDSEFCFPRIQSAEYGRTRRDLERAKPFLAACTACNTSRSLEIMYMVDGKSCSIYLSLSHLKLFVSFNQTGFEAR